MIATRFACARRTVFYAGHLRARRGAPPAAGMLYATRPHKCLSISVARIFVLPIFCFLRCVAQHFGGFPRLASARTARPRALGSLSFRVITARRPSVSLPLRYPQPPFSPTAHFATSLVARYHQPPPLLRNAPVLYSRSNP